MPYRTVLHVDTTRLHSTNQDMGIRIFIAVRYGDTYVSFLPAVQRRSKPSSGIGMKILEDKFQDADNPGNPRDLNMLSWRSCSFSSCPFLFVRWAFIGIKRDPSTAEGIQGNSQYRTAESKIAGFKRNRFAPLTPLTCFSLDDVFIIRKPVRYRQGWLSTCRAENTIS